MCKKALSVLLALVMCLALVPATASAADTYSWAGTWSVTESWGTMTLTQNGSSVSGTYTYQDGTISGTVSGNTFTGNWSQKGNNRSGQFEAVMSGDGKTVTIKYKYDGETNWASTIANGTRTSALPQPDSSATTQNPDTSKDPAKPVLAPSVSNDSWAGRWDVRGIGWGVMTLTQNGNTVSGTYTWMDGKISGTIANGIWSGRWEQPGNNRSGNFEAAMREDGSKFEIQWQYDSNLNMGVDWHTDEWGSRLWNDASGWASDELLRANDAGLIPDSLKNADLSKNITRKEFAAVAVKTYENLTGKTTAPAAKNPFTDTNDTEVLKAYNVGITSGTSATTFSPDVLLNREQAATMLTRVLKASYIPGWTGATDGNYTLNFTQPAKFADDDKISDWAKPSVYFMAANGIIAGTGNNMFSPRAITTAEQAANYASATREQALVIAVRMVENLKGKPLDYKEGAAQGTEPTKPTDPPSGSIDQKLIGTWSNGSGTREIRKILSGKYDIRGFSYDDVGTSYTFNADGTYMSISIIGTGVSSVSTGKLVIIEGRYSVSNDSITLTNRTSKTTSKTDVPIVWESTSKLADEAHSIKFGTSTLWGWDILYFDGATEEAYGFSRSEDV